MTHFIHANSGSSNSHFLLKYCLCKLLIYILRHRPNMMDKSLNSESAQEWTWILFLEFEDKQEQQLKEPSRAQWESFRPNESHFHFLAVLAQPPPPHPPWPRLNNGQTSRHHWARMNCFSIAEECSALHIHSQTVRGRISCQIHKYMYFLASLLATTEHIWPFAKHLEDWIQQICRWQLQLNLGETDN